MPHCGQISPKAIKLKGPPSHERKNSVLEQDEDINGDDFRQRLQQTSEVHQTRPSVRTSKRVGPRKRTSRKYIAPVLPRRVG